MQDFPYGYILYLDRNLSFNVDDYVYDIYVGEEVNKVRKFFDKYDTKNGRRLYIGVPSKGIYYILMFRYKKSTINDNYSYYSNVSSNFVKTILIDDDNKGVLPNLQGQVEQGIYDSDGNLIGSQDKFYIDEYGNIRDNDGNVVTINENGELIDENGNIITDTSPDEGSQVSSPDTEEGNDTTVETEEQQFNDSQQKEQLDNYLQNTLGLQYEFQQLTYDVWEHINDEQFDNDHNNINRNGYYDDFLDSVMVTDNVQMEQSISRSQYSKHKLKLMIVNEQTVSNDISQGSIQTESSLTQNYQYNIEDNLYKIKIGDIIKDREKKDVYYKVTNVTNKVTFDQDIDGKYVSLFELELNRININLIPEEISQYY